MSASHQILQSEGRDGMPRKEGFANDLACPIPMGSSRGEINDSNERRVIKFPSSLRSECRTRFSAGGGVTRHAVHATDYHACKVESKTRQASACVPQRPDNPARQQNSQQNCQQTSETRNAGRVESRFLMVVLYRPLQRLSAAPARNTGLIRPRLSASEQDPEPLPGFSVDCHQEPT